LKFFGAPSSANGAGLKIKVATVVYSAKKIAEHFNAKEAFGNYQR